MTPPDARAVRDRLPKAARLLTRGDFDLASRGASSVVTAHFKVVRGRGPAGPVRLGLIVSRKVGGAVERNRIKRVVREWFRRARHTLPPNLDIIVIARSGAARLGLAEAGQELEGAARQAGRGARRP